MITILGTILIVLATIAIGLLVDRKIDLLPRRDRLRDAGKKGLPAPAYKPGEAPATAIAASPGEIEKFRRQKCDQCRGETDTLADEHVTYEEHDLLVLRTRCRACGQARSVYIREE